jgi:hypothetical protein
MSGLSVVEFVAVALAVQWLFSESAVKLARGIKRHARNSVLRLALSGWISWGNALPLLNWLEAHS